MFEPNLSIFDMAVSSTTLVATFYKFAPLDDYRVLRAPLLARCKENSLRGTILLAEEGINGTLAGEPDDIRDILEFLREDPRLVDLAHKQSTAETMPFHRMKVRLKKEIVTMGVPDIDPPKQAGEYVPPKKWNALISDPEVFLIDARNDYEVSVGKFQGAMSPETASFRELPEWLEMQEALYEKKPPVAMYCTGGIRCEKSTALLREHGFDEVYHLEGGILKYLEEVPPEESLWKGECFVFDDRVSVDHSLKPGSYDLCYACRMPLSEADKASKHYEKGVSCPHCYDLHTDENRRRFAERQKQIVLAKERGEKHLASQ